MTCGIYTITCNRNNIVYVGQSSNIKSRWRDHRKNLKANKHHNKFMQASYNKYGESSFIYNVYLECTVLELSVNEQSVAEHLRNHGILLFNIGEYLPAPARGLKRPDNSVRLTEIHADPIRKAHLLRGVFERAARLKGSCEMVELMTKASHARVRKDPSKLKNKPYNLRLHKGTPEHFKMKSELIKARYAEGSWGIGIQPTCRPVTRLDTCEVFISISALAIELNTSKQALKYQLDKGSGVCKGVNVAYSDRIVSGVKK